MEEPFATELPLVYELLFWSLWESPLAILASEDLCAEGDPEPFV